MTRVVVLGDSRVGKTEFMHRATGGQVPLNIYTSVRPERFQLVGMCTTAEFTVVPGRADRAMLMAACDGADAIVVIYNGSIHNATRWLMRCTGRKQTSVPILICQHNSAQPPDRRVPDALRDWPTAEHTCTSALYTTGLQDCANRIVRRARSEHGSPLGS